MTLVIKNDQFASRTADEGLRAAFHLSRRVWIKARQRQPTRAGKLESRHSQQTPTLSFPAIKTGNLGPSSL